MHPEEQDTEVLSRVLSFVEDAPVWGDSTLVHAAARRGHGIKEALDKEPWALNELDYTGECPIHAASKAGNKNAVEDLIQANASVNMKVPTGQTALMLASANEHVDCVRLLLRHSDINIDQRDNDGFTALFRAARVCDPEVVAALLAEGASLSVRDINGKSPLHRLGDDCTNHERIKQTLQLLLASGKINIDVFDDYGASPLMNAISNSRVAPLRCLVEAGASMQLLDKYGANVLHQAAISDLGVLQYLLGLDPTMFRGISPNQLDAWLDTPWDDFQNTLSPGHIIYREKSSHEASEAAFDQLLQIAQDVNLRWEIDILESTLTHVRQSRVDEARSQLNSVIVQRKRWKDDERVRYYRGISQQIQAGDFEGVITALEEEIEDLEGQIGSSPWLEDSDSSLSNSSDITSSEEEGDHTDGGEDGDDPYETAESGDEVETEDTGTAL
jgi:ankyrin repeat protein